MTDGAMINQFELFSRISVHGFVQRRDSGCCSSFSGEAMIWPDMSIPTPGVTQDADGVRAFLDSAGIPKTLMLQKEDLVEADFTALSEAFYRPVGEWVNMSYQTGNTGCERRLFRDDFFVDRINEAGSPYLSQWVEIVASQLFRGNRLDMRLVNTMVADKVFALYAGVCEGTLVSTGMSFSGSATGIYMVATAGTHQRRGFGAEILREMLADIRSAGRGEAFLQSTPAGIRLYQSLGFVERSRSILFYKIK